VSTATSATSANSYVYKVQAEYAQVHLENLYITSGSFQSTYSRYQVIIPINVKSLPGNHSNQRKSLPSNHSNQRKLLPGNHSNQRKSLPGNRYQVIVSINVSRYQVIIPINVSRYQVIIPINVSRYQVFIPINVKWLPGNQGALAAPAQALPSPGRTAPH